MVLPMTTLEHNLSRLDVASLTPILFTLGHKGHGFMSSPVAAIASSIRNQYLPLDGSLLAGFYMAGSSGVSALPFPLQVMMSFFAVNLLFWLLRLADLRSDTTEAIAYIGGHPIHETSLVADPGSVIPVIFFTVYETRYEHPLADGRQ